MIQSWHAPPDLLTRYAQRPSAVDDVTAASLEAHLLACGDCRAVVAASAPVAELDDLWAGIADRIDQPRASAAERLLHRLGVGPEAARLIGATRALQLAWLASLVAAVAIAVLAADAGDGEGAFLVVAPLLPLAAVGVAFAAGADPIGELGQATPLAGVGLLLRRAVPVLVAAFAVLAVTSGLLPAGRAHAAWILPALALAVGAIALSTTVGVERAAAGLAGAWLGGLLVLWLLGRPTQAEDIAAFQPGGQAALAALAALAAAATFARRHATLPIGGQR